MPRPLRPQPRLVAVDKTPVPPLTGVECLAALPTRPKTQDIRLHTEHGYRVAHLIMSSLPPASEIIFVASVEF